MPTNEQIYDEATKLKDRGELEPAVTKLHELLVQDPNYSLAHSAR